jgi:vacuolar-type H+-ATPase subunit E/Vma4
MIDEINKIIESDEAAREEVQTARAEADRIRSHALRRAEEIALEKKGELSTSVGAEQEAILSEARLRADHAMEEADRYINRLREKKNAVLNELVGNLLKRVTSI